MNNTKTTRAFLIFVQALLLSIMLGFTTKAEAQVGVRSYKQVVDFLNAVATQYPNSAKVFDLGANDSGQMIKGLMIGTGSNTNINNLVVGTHHGNEYGSTGVALGFALATAANPIQGQNIFVIPVLNIPGFDKNNRYENNRDPNRDYPGPCATQGPHKLKSTALLAMFVDKLKITTSATLHTYYPGVLYPWGVSTHDLSTPYDDIFIQLAKYATVESKYKVGNSTAELYPADGTFEDYAFWAHGIWSLLFEMGNTHSPSDQAVQTMINVNVPGLRRMFEMAPKARAASHNFTGKCDVRLRQFDLGME
ncbi:MAG: M14 family zinc carboxypeptidase [Bdellovibrionia bacterium]